MGRLRSILKVAAKPIRPLLARLDLLSPRVGIAVLIFHDDKILLGKRQNSYIGSGCWQCAGGHLEFNESFYKCAARETLEETGLRLLDMEVVATTNNAFPDELRHYITVWVSAYALDPSELQQGLEDKCSEWRWFDLKELPSPLFEASKVLTTVNVLKIRQGILICVP